MSRTNQRAATQPWGENPHIVRLTVSVLITLIVAALLPLVLNQTDPRSGPPPLNAAPGSTAVPSPLSGVGHVYVINLENKGYDRVWDPDSGAPYLSTTLRSQGVLLTQYYAIARSSLPNYIAQISGQAPNARTLNNCARFVPFVWEGTVPPGQAVGSGCLYPTRVPTIASQLSDTGRSWKGYMGDMETPCRHPQLGDHDGSQSAKVGDQYATRHNPFVYFEAITSSPDCRSNVVDLASLSDDLTSIKSTPRLSYITPNLCDNGHDKPCVDGRHGGLQASNTWLKQWVPAILASPAFKEDGLLVITFDESDESNQSLQEGNGCCSGGADAGPTAPGGTGGGRVGALLLSPFITGGTSSDVVYNHYSLLASIEDVFSLPYLGYAGAYGLNRFGSDVYNAP